MGEKHSFGSKALDELTGGLESGILTEIYGETSTGKTTLGAYMPICNIACEGEFEKDDRFIVIDADGGHDAERAMQIWKHHKLKVEDIVTHTEYFQPTEFAEQHDLISHLDTRIKEAGWNPLLITADAMTAIYRGIFLRTDMKHKMSVVGTYTGKLDLQLATLRGIAVNHKCPVIATNWTMSGVGMRKEGEARPDLDFIGGRAFGYLGKTILKLENILDEKRVIKKVTLKKHRAKKPGEFVNIELWDGGIRDA
jgi:RecA/RadA recombinase